MPKLEILERMSALLQISIDELKPIDDM
jgi:hypothetical protein